MKYLGSPFSIQNTDGRDWLVSWQDVIADAENGENVSFTVAIPRQADLSIESVQKYALKRGVELLQQAIRNLD